jgi:diguanylate cyclase (GGDEF)-like protein
MPKAFPTDHSSRLATPPGVQHPGEQMRKVIAAASALSSRSDRAPPNTAGLDRALEVGSERLRHALRRIDALETQGLQLKHQVALLQRAVAQARRSAYHDELTRLPNRRLLLDRYNHAVALAARQHRSVALLFLDLDDFKKINDTHGHAAGDRILQQVAERLHASIRAYDTACRYCGDEFVILLPGLAGRRSALAAARKIRSRLAAPYPVHGTEITVTASIGTAVYPVDGHEYDDLMRATDTSMYLDKAREDASNGHAARRQVILRSSREAAARIPS